MAKLLSEDQEFASVLEIVPGRKRDIQGQDWRQYSLILTSGTYSLSLDTDDCLICRAPTDEIAQLLGKLQQLKDGKRDKVSFEPSEPSFELNLMRSDGGIRVEIWLDSGNASTGIYRWDAAGIRFFTVDEQLESFINQLREEFA